MDVLVFGAGSLGSLVGGLLARAGHDVTLVGRDPHVAAIRGAGLHVGGEFDFTVHPTARTTAPEHADIAVVTVKAFDTETAARALEGVPDVTLSLGNGMGNEATLAEHLDTVLAGTCTYGALRPEPGVVHCTGVGEVVLGPRDGGESEAADRVGRAFADAMVTTVADDMPRRLWEKLAVNAGINAPTALARVENGALVEGPGNEVARAAGREVAALARAEGVDLPDEAAVDAVVRVAEATAANHSSMLQDVAAERRTEVDAITGYVADLAPERGVETPVNATLASLLRAWERERGLR
ncbi:ketopantoate reductase family protein [Salinirubellus salinus]|uniref:2-dehydropantoate 2-reductase n=1 Tax=Salinirubellus salinus TaxID=1364945 RepID=A0A9E7R3F0_9EURY|nr:ketopantoate reductase family protein [Salinirubellus salinus]UWM54068.1 ketopantoate reductase family protein [Salinirubellus salinus]